MAYKAASAIRQLFIFAPLAAGMIFGGLCLEASIDWLGLPAILLLMLGIIPVLLCHEDRPFPLIAGGLFVLAAGVFLCYFLYTVSAPFEREELTEVQGTFASIQVIRRRGLDDYRIRLQGNKTSYRGLAFLGFPGEAISNEAKEGDTVEIVYSEQGRSIYAFRLNGRDFLTYEAACQAKDENRRAAWLLLVIPAAVCAFRFWGAFRGTRKRTRWKPYRYTGRRR